jgi:MarR family 2-MHQ and catechol resistance regulon transcriptional repressor
MAAKRERTDALDGTAVFFNLWRSYRALLTRADESKRRVGLGVSDFRILGDLMRNGPRPINAIGHDVELTTGSITTAIDRLEAQKLVVRRSDDADRRLRVVDLTPKGRSLGTNAYAEHARDLEDAVRDLSRDERRTLIALLKKIRLTDEE